MTVEELRAHLDISSFRDIVKRQTDLTCTVYQQGFQDCFDMFIKLLKEKGIEL